MLDPNLKKKIDWWFVDDASSGILWILTTGFWVDSNFWVDFDTWID